MAEAPGERVEISLAVAARAGRVLVRRRREPSHLAGTFEFPGGKIEPGEEPLQAARRELREETGLAGGAFEPLIVHLFDYPDRNVRLHVFLVREPQAAENLPPGGWSWVSLDDLAALPMPEANGPIVQALRWRLAD